MSNAARKLIEDIAADMNSGDLTRITNALNDGAALAAMGMTDQNTVEAAADMVAMWQSNGITNMDE